MTTGIITLIISLLWFLFGLLTAGIMVVIEDVEGYTLLMFLFWPVVWILELFCECRKLAEDITEWIAEKKGE